NITQFGFILAILLGMGAIAGEKERGTASMILSKPLSRGFFVVSKYVAQSAVYLLAFILAAIAATYYMVILFDTVNLVAFLAINLLLLAWLLVFAAITLLGSAIGRTTVAAGGMAFLGSVLLGKPACCWRKRCSKYRCLGHESRVRSDPTHNGRGSF
ncbi:MAG: hypothetical protein AMJ56_09740, partial [Anaerolineae bacterium SG8_19]